MAELSNAALSPQPSPHKRLYGRKPEGRPLHDDREAADDRLVGLDAGGVNRFLFGEPALGVADRLGARTGAVVVEGSVAAEGNRAGDQLRALRRAAAGGPTAVHHRIVREVGRSGDVQRAGPGKRVAAGRGTVAARTGRALLEKSDSGGRPRCWRCDVQIGVALNVEGARVARRIAAALTRQPMLKHKCDAACGLQGTAGHAKVGATRKDIDPRIEGQNRIVPIGVHLYVLAEDVDGWGSGCG